MRKNNPLSLKQIFLLVAFSLGLLTACSRKAEPTPQLTETVHPPPVDVTYCDIDPADICLEGFGLDPDEKLLVTFIVTDPIYADIYIRADGPDGEILFECQESESFPENVYCLGEPFPDGELIKLNIYSKGSNKFLAIGVFTVQLGALAAPDVIFQKNATQTPSPQPSYQNPSFSTPSYQNPTFPTLPYPNPTSVP